MSARNSVSDVTRDFFDPTPEQQVVVLVEAATLRQAEQLIESCEYCNEEGAEIPFDAILDRVMASDPTVTALTSHKTTSRESGRRRKSLAQFSRRPNTLI